MPSLVLLIGLLVSMATFLCTSLTLLIVSAKHPITHVLTSHLPMSSRHSQHTSLPSPSQDHWKTPDFPLARIKKIMRIDDEVKVQDKPTLSMYM